MKEHQYHTQLTWTGNTGLGTKTYASYERSHTITITGKAELLCSSDPSFRGDYSKYNPEELLIASLSSCHMLWYLHLCAVNNITVLAYTDTAKGLMIENADGSGRFTEVILNPEVTLAAEEMIDKANELHHQANKMCFIANSCNFPIHHKAKYRLSEEKYTL